MSFLVGLVEAFKDSEDRRFKEKLIGEERSYNDRTRQEDFAFRREESMRELAARRADSLLQLTAERRSRQGSEATTVNPTVLNAFAGRLTNSDGDLIEGATEFLAQLNTNPEAAGKMWDMIQDAEKNRKDGTRITGQDILTNFRLYGSVPAVIEEDPFSMETVDFDRLADDDYYTEVARASASQREQDQNNFTIDVNPQIYKQTQPEVDRLQFQATQNALSQQITEYQSTLEEGNPEWSRLQSVKEGVASGDPAAMAEAIEQFGTPEGYDSNSLINPPQLQGGQNSFASIEEAQAFLDQQEPGIYTITINGVVHRVEVQDGQEEPQSEVLHPYD
jgi:hypothetical protein